MFLLGWERKTFLLVCRTGSTSIAHREAGAQCIVTPRRGRIESAVGIVDIDCANVLAIEKILDAKKTGELPRAQRLIYTNAPTGRCVSGGRFAVDVVDHDSVTQAKQATDSLLVK